MGCLLWILRWLVDQRVLHKLDIGQEDPRKSGLRLLDLSAAVGVPVLTGLGWERAAAGTGEGYVGYVGRWIGSLLTRCNLKVVTLCRGYGDVVVLEMKKVSISS